MRVELGIKSDAVEYRYSYSWLFTLMQELEVHHLQLGSSFEMYWLPDRYFTRLRRQAEDHDVAITSCFTAHRELGGLLSEDPDLQRVALANYKRYIEIGKLVGATSVGSNPGAIYRDQMHAKQAAIERYLAAMADLQSFAKSVDMGVLTLETMSSLSEPPTTCEEITRFMDRLNEGPADSRSPVYVCGDISHGLADEDGVVVESNVQIFEHSIPWMWEFHFKNTDGLFHSTFGFEPENAERGIVDLEQLARVINSHADDFPGNRIVGYLELPGPKLGRDYSDHQLEHQTRESVTAINREFFPLIQNGQIL